MEWICLKRVVDIFRIFAKKIIMKTCSKCKVKKDFLEFRRDKSKKDGHRPECKLCAREVTHRYISTDEFKEKKKELNRAYRKNNKEKIKTYNKLFR